jgi:hypothetical protein
MLVWAEYKKQLTESSEEKQKQTEIEITDISKRMEISEIPVSDRRLKNKRNRQTPKIFHLLQGKLNLPASPLKVWTPFRQPVFTQNSHLTL